jgi:hypothetical protein
MLDQFPSLVASSAARLLPNFVGLIAQPRHIRADASGYRQLKMTSSTLIINPNSQLSTQKWRLRVLRRLAKFFSAVAKDMQHSKTHCAVEPNCITVDNEGRMSAACCLHSPINISCSAFIDFVLQPTVNEASLESVTKVQSWLQSLLPLLIECWVEASSGASQHQRSELSAESLTLLYSIVSVVQPLFEYVTEGIEESESLTKWLRMNYGCKFTHHFMNGFPYRAMSDHLVKRGKLDTEIPYKPSSFVSTNLSLCLVMTTLLCDNCGSNVMDVGFASSAWPSTVVDRTQLVQPSVNSPLVMVINYVMDILRKNRGGSMLGLNHLQQIFLLVERLTCSPIAEELRLKLLKSCCDAATMSSHEPSSGLSKAWFKFLYKFVFDGRSAHLVFLDVELEKWFASLPNLLLSLGRVGDSSTADVLAAILKAGTRQHASFLCSFSEQLPSFLDDSFMRCIGPALSGRLVESLSWIPSVSSECFRRLTVLCMDGALPVSVVRNLLGILEYRCSTSPGGERQQEADQFVVLMLSIVLRATMTDLKCIEDRYLGQVRGDAACCCFIMVDDECLSVMCKGWPEQQLLIKCVFDTILMTSNRRHIIKLLAAFISHILTSHRIFTVITACAMACTLSYVLDFARNMGIVEFDLKTAVVTLLKGLCQCLNDLDPAIITSSSSASPDADSLFIVQQAEEQQRTISKVVTDLVHSSPPYLLDTVKELITAGLLRDSVLVHLSASIPDLVVASSGHC